jgi:hypothetical protein
VIATVALGAEEEQMFEEVCQARPGCRYVMAACGNAHEGCGALETGFMVQAHVQAVVQNHVFGGWQ